MMKRIRTIIIPLLLLATAGAVLAAGPPPLSRYVIAGGGGVVAAGTYKLSGTIGQPMTGQVQNGAYELCAGFWCGLTRYEVFLPLILRQ